MDVKLIDIGLLILLVKATDNNYIIMDKIRRIFSRDKILAVTIS